MKQKLKQYIKTGLFLLGMSFFIVSCQKDDDFKTTQQESLTAQNVFKVSKVGESKINENGDLLGRLSSLSEKVEQSRLANANKSIYSSEDDFYINTDFATYLENNVTGYHSYTFPVFRTEQVEGVVENVLLSLQEDGSYKASLIVYDLNNQEQLDLQNELNVDLTGKTTIYSLEDDSFIDDIFSKVLASGDCVGILMCPYGGDDHVAGQACIDAERGNLYLDTSMCDSGGGGGVGDSDGGNPSDTDTDTSTGHVEAGGTGSGSTVVTIPQPWEEVALCLGLNSGFTSDMAIWLQAQPKNVAGPINGFLQNDNCSEESQMFAVNVIQVLMADPDANPLLGVDCRSFEYAQPPGALQKACAVSDFTNRFYGAYAEANGSAGAGYVESHWDTAYFTMPPGMTNGQAANLTAEAITQAVHATDVWFIANASETQYAVGQEFIQNIQSFMGTVGGQMVVEPPFNIPSPAPYLTHMGGATTDCN